VGRLVAAIFYNEAELRADKARLAEIPNPKEIP
jgi:hypothetical protein